MLRRLTVKDADLVATAVAESFEHLRPWMPWATPQAMTRAFQRRRLAGPAGRWDPGGDYGYGLFLAGADAMVGGAGLHRRAGPRALEIGYWVHVAHLRQGVATAAARALTTVSFTVTGIERVEIHCDAANGASAAVPRKLGYRLVGHLEHAPEAPAEEGRRLLWAVTRAEWPALAASG